MSNSKLERAVRMGLQLAAGKPIEEATAVMMECLELVVDISQPQIGPPKKPLAPAPVFSEDIPVEAIAPLLELVPITGAPQEKQTVRIYWDVAALQEKILAEAPTEMEVKITDAGDTIKIFRTISQDSGLGAAPGIQLGYRPQNPDRAIPYPKTTFWVTNEVLDIASDVSKMRIAAESMYKVRTMPQTKQMVARPLRFTVGGDIE